MKAQDYRGLDPRMPGQSVTDDYCREQGQVPAGTRAPQRSEWCSLLCTEKGAWHPGLLSVRDIGQR